MPISSSPHNIVDDSLAKKFPINMDDADSLIEIMSVYIDHAILFAEHAIHSCKQLDKIKIFQLTSPIDGLCSITCNVAVLIKLLNSHIDKDLDNSTPLPNADEDIMNKMKQIQQLMINASAYARSASGHLLNASELNDPPQRYRMRKNKKNFHLSTPDFIDEKICDKAVLVSAKHLPSESCGG